MNILCFGIAKELIGSSLLQLPKDVDIKDVYGLRTYLIGQFPEFKQYKPFMIAVNQTYADDQQRIQDHDEIAIIPPVSGG